MTPENARAFAERIAAASCEHEPELFAEAAIVLADGRFPVARARWRRLLRAGALNELAIALYRHEFPDCGFHLGRSAVPAFTGLASTWRAHDAHAIVHRAATPALALLRATLSDGARRDQAQRKTRCSLCGGLGWFIAADNAKHICRHDGEAA